MEKEIIVRLHKDFEQSLYKEENTGMEFWLARKLQDLLGYSQWRSFESVIERAKTACKNAGQNPDDHFAQTRKMVDRLNIPQSRALADFLPTITIKAKDFANEITNFNIKRDNLRTEARITKEHIKNNQEVRKLLIKRSIKVEELPPAEDIKKIERKLIAEQKKLNNAEPLGNKNDKNKTP